MAAHDPEQTSLAATGRDEGAHGLANRDDGRSRSKNTASILTILAAIGDASQTCVQAYLVSDWTAVVAVLTEDAFWMPPNQPGKIGAGRLVIKLSKFWSDTWSKQLNNLITGTEIPLDPEERLQSRCLCLLAHQK
jgi:hypothetical protein